MRPFVRDALIALIAAAIPMVLVGWLAYVLPWGDPDAPSALALAPLYLVYLVPLALLAVGLLHQREGFVAGVVACVVLAYGWIGVSLWSQASAIRALEVTAPARSGPGQGLIALPTVQACDKLCIQLIASGRYNVAIPGRTGWWVWSRLQGSACESDALDASRIQFARAGYRGMCAHSSAVSEIRSALVIAEYQLSGKGVRGPGTPHPIASGNSALGRIAAQVPAFAGTVYELSELRYGDNTLLARRFRGTVSSAADRIAFSLLPGPVSIGAMDERTEFYEAATGLSLSPTDESGSAEARETFDRLVRELMASDLESDLRGGDRRLALAERFGGFAGKMAGADPDRVRGQVEQFLESGSPLLTHAGLLALYYGPQRDLTFVREQLLGLLESEDPAIVGIALRRAGEAFALADDPLIKQGTLEIAFRNELFETDSALTSGGTAYAELIQYKTYEEPVRSRAKEFLLEEDDLSDQQCTVLFRILGTGRQAAIDEAIDVLAALPPRSFAMCAGELKPIRRPNDAPVSRTLTRDQIDALMRRAQELDATRLAELWSGVAQTRDDRERAAPALRDRIAALRDEADEDPDSLALLHKLAQDAAK